MPNKFRLFVAATLAAAVCITVVAADKKSRAKDTKPTAMPAGDYKLVPADLFATADDALEVTVWATSPMLFNPANMDIDKDGRIWVAEGVNYRKHLGRRPEGDRIAVIEDTNGDGKADKSWTFVQETFLVAPLGVAVFDNKIVVSQTPSIIVYTDVNRNLKFDPGVDKREEFLTGFNGRNHDHSLHSVYGGPDGKWYFSAGNCGALFTDKSGKTFRIGSPYDPKPVTPENPTIFDSTELAGKKSDDGRVWIGGFAARINPDGTHAEIVGHNFRNSYEQAVTSFGDMFQNDNDDPPACRVTHVIEGGNAGFASRDGKRAWRADMRPGQTIPIAEWRQEDPGTMPAGDVYGGGSPTGVAFYENGALGRKWEGMLLASEAGRNVVFGYLPKRDGAGFKLERFDFLTSNKEKAFAGSDFLGGTTSVNNELKTLFRPSDVCVGPDGAIYVTDWFDGRVGGHADLDDSTVGTIYRIAPKGFKSKLPKIDYSTTEGLIEALKSPAVNVRFTGFTGLKAQGEKAVPAVAKLLRDRNPYVAARAIWLLAQLGETGVAKVTPLLNSKDENTRLTAYRALRRAGHDMTVIAAKMADDKSAAVRAEVAFTMRDLPLAKSRDNLVAVAKKFDGKDRSYLEAVGTGSVGKESDIYSALLASAGTANGWSDAFAWLAWRLGSPAAVKDLKTRALDGKLSSAQRKLMMDALAFIPTREAALAMTDLAATKDFPHAAAATWWLFNRKGNDWSAFGLDALMKEKGLYDPDKVTLSSVVMPDAPAGASQLPATAQILKLKGDAKRGETAVIVCYTCHQIGSQGIDYGPNLTMFGKTQTREVLINAIVSPSADIAHGYEGSRVTAKDGTIIDGMVLSNGDPVIVKSMAGQVQTVPRKMVRSVVRLDRSLMFSADMLGLSAESLADIAAYLQSDLIK